MEMTWLVIGECSAAQNAFRPRLYWRYMLYLAASLALLTVGLTVLAREITQPANPFGEYATLVPERSIPVAMAYRFSCLDSRLREIVRQSNVGNYCYYRSAIGTFTYVGVLISRNHQIREVFFGVRAGCLTVGDLVLLWGKPLVRPFDRHHLRLFWMDGRMSAIVRWDTGRFNNYLFVDNITLTDDSVRDTAIGLP